MVVLRLVGAQEWNHIELTCQVLIPELALVLTSVRPVWLSAMRRLAAALRGVAGATSAAGIAAGTSADKRRPPVSCASLPPLLVRSRLFLVCTPECVQHLLGPPRRSIWEDSQEALFWMRSGYIGSAELLLPMW